MSGFILRPEKLAKLSQGFQDAVKALDRTQLSYLQAAFSNHAYFDILSLPLEIRVQILRETLPTSLYMHNSRSLKKDASAKALAFLTVNKQISSEARMALVESTTMTLSFMYNHDLLRRQKEALRILRRFDVTIDTGTLPFKWENDKEICKLLMRICNEVVKGHQSKDANARFVLSVFLGQHWRYQCVSRNRTKTVPARIKVTSADANNPTRSKSEQILHQLAMKLHAKLVDRLPNSNVSITSIGGKHE